MRAQWFLTEGAQMHFQGGASPYAPHNTKSLIMKFTKQYICFYSLFKAWGAWNKGQLLKGGVVEVRLRTSVRTKTYLRQAQATASIKQLQTITGKDSLDVSIDRLSNVEL